MRHFLAPLAIAAHPGGMRHTTAPAALVTATRLAQAGSARGLRAVAIPVSLAAITTAADDDLRPATGAHVQAACGRLHWRLLQNAKDEEESNQVDGPREQCDTDGSLGSPAGRQARHMDTLWRRSAGLDLAVEAGAAPVVLLWQTPFYHADGPSRFRARLQSPYGLPTPCPESTSRSPCVECFRGVCLHACAPPPNYDAAVYCRFSTAVHKG